MILACSVGTSIALITTPSECSGARKCEEIIDSGATNTAVGARWVGRYYSQCSMPRIEEGFKSFKFGDFRTSKSIGAISLTVNMDVRGNTLKTRTRQACEIKADVIGAEITLRISRYSLAELRCELSFTDNMHKLPNGKCIPMKIAPTGTCYWN